MNICMKEKLTELCKGWGADLVGFAPIDRFPADSAVRKLLPEAKTVIGLGFRVLRGAYRGIEEGSTYYQYTTMGVENLEETVMPLALINVANLIEDDFIGDLFDDLYGGLYKSWQDIPTNLHKNPEFFYQYVIYQHVAPFGAQLERLYLAIQDALGPVPEKDEK